jgi:hypothetical protein
MNKILIYFLLLAGDDAVLEKEGSSPPPPSSEIQTGRTGRKERTGGTGGTGGTGRKERAGGTGKRTESEASARTPSSQIRYIHTFQKSRASLKNQGELDRSIGASLPFTTFWGEKGPNHRGKKLEKGKQEVVGSWGRGGGF